MLCKIFLISSNNFSRKSVACQRRHNACFLSADVVESLEEFQVSNCASWTSCAFDSFFAVDVYIEGAIEFRYATGSIGNFIYISNDSLSLRFEITRLRVQLNIQSRLDRGLISWA